MITTRRTFLKQSVGATSLLASGVTLPGFLCRTAAASRPERDQRILVVIQMTGGNDGLNTVIPVGDDAYHRARPTLRIDSSAAHILDKDLALHPEMSTFKRLFDDGWLSVVNNVGYPNPDRSHFRSMDIWQTASLEPERVETGWIGRIVDREGAGAEAALALHLDHTEMPLALRSSRGIVPSIRNINAFSLEDHGGNLEESLAAARRDAADDLLFVQRVAVASCAQARRLEGIAAGEDAGATYPQFGLAQRLRQIAQLIAADFGPRIYYTSFDGFDTHAQQATGHGPLLKELSDSVAAFTDDLAGRKIADRVLVMTFSEFGRRVMENGSRGTDHGAAAPMFIVGPGAAGGLIGDRPVLDDPSGDVPHTVDFREVYAAVLDRWLGIEHAAILGKRYQPTAVIRAGG